MNRVNMIVHKILPAVLVCLLAGCASAQQATDNTPASAQSAQTQEASSGSEATDKADSEDTGTAGVADASQMASVEDVVTDDMIPVPVSSLNDGKYYVTVDSSSSMFQIVDCILTVEDGKATAEMTMGGSGYQYVFPGSAAEAAAAGGTGYIEAGESPAGTNLFIIPVEALDAGIPCAAYSKKKELWYDRTIVFRADSLPLSAFADGTFETADSLGIADGTYTVDVTLTGGTGRAGVQSPCRLFVENGTATAEIIWSSDNYDYMKVDGEQIMTEIVDGHSVCVIPVAAFNHPLAVIADTTAMSTPHEIDYTLTFDASTLAEEP
ncbi:MAG: hypothetical protein IJQ21_03240 [Lachnospiraceae bacterium]|nr:hypothetical protein [Lachnospiraceae bacterium]